MNVFVISTSSLSFSYFFFLCFCVLPSFYVCSLLISGFYRYIVVHLSICVCLLIKYLYIANRIENYVQCSGNIHLFFLPFVVGLLSVLYNDEMLGLIESTCNSANPIWRGFAKRTIDRDRKSMKKKKE